MVEKFGDFRDLYNNNKRQCTCSFVRSFKRIKRSSQNDFVYGVLGRVPLQNNVFHSVKKLYEILEPGEYKILNLHTVKC